MKIDESLLAGVKGFLEPVEGRRLYQATKEASRLGPPCLEIGSYCGKSTVYLASGCKSNNGILFSVDHHRGSEEQQPGEEYFDPDLFDSRSGRVDTLRDFRNTLETFDLEETVAPLVCRSDVAARAWATPLALVFIDGGHAYETAKTDYDVWSGHIIPGGLLLIHDIFPDPADGGQAPYQVYNHALASGRFTELPMTETLGALKRK
ncbi:MAG: class I SAM-dependent methyltransferase [Desulfobacterales bacterium]|nr:class I SAM-dependent methyltransferase [Desulfobacterales bacterium]